MKCHLLLANSLCSWSLVPQSHPTNSLNGQKQPLSCLNRANSLHFSPLSFSRNFNFKAVEGIRFDGPIVDMSELAEIGDGDWLLETCVTRTLPPALTLERGLEFIKEAVDELKLNPPSSSSGIMRFQVAVPPSAKALNWFCCQPESSAVFPLFFLSKETENPTCKSLFMNRTRGTFGIGTAISFMHSSSRASTKWNSIKRYLLNDSMFITTYGFMDINFDKESSMKYEANSFYFFIPQIELDDHESVSILAATLAWSDSLSWSFDQAIDSLELSFYQARSGFWSTTERHHSDGVRSALRKLNVMVDETIQMVYMNALSLGRRDLWADSRELRAAPSSCQFLFKLSPSIVIASNLLDHASEVSYSIQDCANINFVWASLIVEECTRLGLTYFCVAPGSRSSPLAIAASAHPLTTCIACFDERSLAFHAVGYARGSLKPAVIITSSGTAVSNLLPAVVEASQDFIPLLLLTADRPPELQDAGANQSINQVNHFGSFVRFFFNLPAPTDLIPARMVLTTIDSAVHWATTSPYGPVHINCPYREPLDASPSKWMLTCLKGLDIWMSNTEPFSKYVKLQYSYACKDDGYGQMKEVLEVIQGTNKGLLLLGAIHTEDEIWAALLLAKQLLWPVVADILSGLRLRKLLSSFPEIKGNVVFVEHLDHALLSDSVRGWIQFDVVIQIGRRITSKRVSQMLEDCFPFSYILVDNHPCRHDPSHLVTHRVQSTIVQFADYLLKAEFPQRRSKLQPYLQQLDMMIAWEISFQIWAERSLTEPYVAHAISKALSSESALFIGNSMAIRDADMYGCNWFNYTHSVADMVLSSELPCGWIQVAGNRGASGIDGLLSTAVGFAVGCQKRVLCVIGDISFLHDTNGLALLNQRTLRKPMTILVINNHGGAIFSLLPIASRTEQKVLDQYFYTSHDISIEKLCAAHGVKHLRVKTKMELQDTLFTSKHEEMDCVIEVDSCIDTNAAFHSTLRKFACQVADHALTVISRMSVPDSISCNFSLCQINEIRYSLYRIQLCDPPTSSYVDNEKTEFYREGFILSLTLEDGTVGYGEVAPLDIHEENLLDVEEQLCILLHVMKGAKISYTVPLLRGSFSSWIWSDLGILPSSIFPSVRCGLEMAVLNAIAVRQGCSLFNVLQSPAEKSEMSARSSGVQICALVDSKGNPAEVAYIAIRLVEEGFTAIKLKVARSADPIQDAAVVQEVRRQVGRQIELRVDANRNWSYEKAIKFSSLVKNCNLQYIEEPVQDEDDIIKYCEESGLPVALDETIDGFRENHFNMLVKYSHPGIVAIVIKPSVIGGFENAALIARWAQQHGKMAVVSAAFESGLSLSAYTLFSSYLELQNAAICRELNRELAPPVAHGLGTYRWLKEDVMIDALGIGRNLCTGFVEASVAEATRLLQKFQINRNVILSTNMGEQVLQYALRVDINNILCSIKVHETGQRSDDNVLLFLHGFLGTGEDWIPVMKALSVSARCISIDFPGHGESKIKNHDDEKAAGDPTLSIEMIAEILCKLIQQITPRKVILVGYSMGARLALYMALRFNDKIEGAVIVSGSPGLKEALARKTRRAKDDSRARILVAHGLQLFLDNWYSGDLWKSLRSHPHFNQIVASRLLHKDICSLAKVLSDLSVGRQPSLWEELKQCNTHLSLVVGEKDEKFKKIAEEMHHEMNDSKKSECEGQKKISEIVEIPNSGHAAHLENPLHVIRAVRRFFMRVKECSSS